MKLQTGALRKSSSRCLALLSDCSRIYRLFFSAIAWIADFIIFHEHVASCVSGGCRNGPGKVSEMGRQQDVEAFLCEMEDLETVR